MSERNSIPSGRESISPSIPGALAWQFLSEKKIRILLSSTIFITGLSQKSTLNQANWSRRGNFLRSFCHDCNTTHPTCDE